MYWIIQGATRVRKLKIPNKVLRRPGAYEIKERYTGIFVSTILIDERKDRDVFMITISHPDKKIDKKKQYVIQWRS